MIKIDSRTPETLDFNIGLSGIRQPDQVLFRLLMSISADMSISFKGVYNDGELAFNIPTLKDIVKLQDREVPFHIEMVVDGYYQIIYESEMEIVNPPQVEITKMTHVKQEVKEEVKKPIKIEKRIEIKEPSKFASGFMAYIKEREI